MGKTHLRFVVALQVIEDRPSAIVLSLRTEQLMDMFVRGDWADALEEIQNSVDLLLVEYINFLETKRVLQELVAEFFETIDRRGGCLLIDVDELMRAFQYVLCLCKFLAGCYNLKVDRPIFSDRKQLAHYWAQRYDLNLLDSVICNIAAVCCGNVCEIESAIYRIKAMLGM